MIAPSAELTLCTVSYRDEEFLALNHALFRHLNGGSEYPWVIGENFPIADVSNISNRGDLTIVPGCNGEYIPSYHHTTTLNLCLKFVKTRYVCIIDPDFFVLRKNWVALTLEYMERNDLAFLGVPWHPKHFTKYRGFPCVHFMLIDLHRVSKDDLDFRPTKKNDIDGFNTKKSSISGLLTRSARTLILNRWRIGREGDTGTRLFHLHSGAGYVDVMKPVLFEDRLFTNQFLEKWNRWLDQFMPPRLRYRPKDGSYVSVSSGEFPHFRDDQWEMFYWMDQPFGFHLRKYKRNRNGDFCDNTSEIVEFLRSFGPSIGEFY